MNEPEPSQCVSAEDELRVSELRYRRLFETAQDGILLLDGATGSITDANPFLLKMLGYAIDDLRGKKLWDIGPFKDIEESRKAFSVLQEDDYIRYEDLPLQSKDGPRVDVEFVSNAYLVDGKRVIQCNIRDITVRKRTENALRSASLQLQRVLARCPTVVYSFTVEGLRIGSLTYASGNIGQLLGKDPPEACQFQWWLDHIHPEDAPRILAEQDRLFKHGSATQDYRFHNQDESYRWIRDEQRLVCDAQNEPVEVVGSWTDITERKGLEYKLIEALKMEAIGRLAGGVAHDFNNLLTVIIGYSQLVQQSDLLPKEMRELLDQILGAAHRAEGLTRQLLAFSRKKVLQPRTADLNEVVAGISTMLQRIIGEDIALSVECSNGQSLVEAGEGSIEQVLLNLAVNARDAMPKGGRLSIDTGRINSDQAGVQGQLLASKGDFVWLRVGDTGCGMTSVTQAQIFEPFFTTKDVGKGTGMGLSTVYGIVQQHRGWIEVASQPGAGSVFTIYLPAATEGSTVARPNDPVAAKLQSGDETILLVEDEPALRAMARKILQRLGYRVYEAGDGIAALSVWAEHRAEIDLLLTDMVMPEGMTGSDLALKLQAEDPELHVVLTSGYNSTDPGSVQLNEGALFMRKPYTLETLSQMIRTCLDSRVAKSVWNEKAESSSSLENTNPPAS